MEDLRFAGVEEALLHIAALDDRFIYYELTVSIAANDVSETSSFSRTCELVAQVFGYGEWKNMEIALLESLPPAYIYFDEGLGQHDSTINRFLRFFRQDVEYWRVANALRTAGFGACPKVFDKQRAMRETNPCKSIHQELELRVVQLGFRRATRYRTTDKELAEIIRARDEAVAEILGRKPLRRPYRRLSRS
ncbi:hypothetical protein PQR70_26120 [Paraburkholderia madseniana]|uniref:hypothetical protein n=1 Tax=Paraburkholderia madseniana TaxID=2599607 RepID=UPI0038BDAD7A